MFTSSDINTVIQNRRRRRRISLRTRRKRMSSARKRLNFLDENHIDSTISDTSFSVNHGNCTSPLTEESTGTTCPTRAPMMKQAPVKKRSTKRQRISNADLEDRTRHKRSRPSQDRRSTSSFEPARTASSRQSRRSTQTQRPAICCTELREKVERILSEIAWVGQIVNSSYEERCISSLVLYKLVFKGLVLARSDFVLRARILSTPAYLWEGKIYWKEPTRSSNVTSFRSMEGYIYGPIQYIPHFGSMECFTDVRLYLFPVAIMAKLKDHIDYDISETCLFSSRNEEMYRGLSRTLSSNFVGLIRTGDDHGEKQQTVLLWCDGKAPSVKICVPRDEEIFHRHFRNLALLYLFVDELL
ncbi:uncharacterized protein [Ptychodera flava]|uniref:uncharacterized protein n=1 Tax=Ptychodera flava TaxID=63121 RepID=UPI003969FDCA